MPQIRPITDIENSAAISNACRMSREPIFLTKDGYGDMVIMSIETYDEMLDCSQIDGAIALSEAQLEKTGIVYDAQTVFDRLRRKHDI